MSYNTASESYRAQGIEHQYDESIKFVNLLNNLLKSNHVFRKSSTEEDMKDKIDFYIDDIPVDIKISNKNVFTLTVISNYFQKNYFEECKSKFILFSNNTHFYFVLLESLKDWVLKTKPIANLTKHNDENSKYIWINIFDLGNMNNVIIIKK